VPEITKSYTKGKITKNTIVYDEDVDELPKFAPTIYMRKAILPHPPEAMKVTFSLPDPV